MQLYAFLGVGDCGDSGFEKVAFGVGEVAESTCPYDSNFKPCKCNPCAGFMYSSAEAMAQGYVSNGSCQSCSVIKYKRKENSCSGYQTCQCGGAIGAGVCYSGSCEKIRPICAIGWIYYGDNTCSLDRRSYGSSPLGG